METPTPTPEQVELRVRHVLRQAASCTETCTEALRSALSAKIADNPSSYAQKLAIARDSGAAAQQALSKMLTDMDSWKSATVNAETRATQRAKDGIAALESTLSTPNQLQG